MPRQISVQIMDATQQQIDALKAIGYESATNVIRTAIDRMYREEIKTMITQAAAQKYGTVTHEGTEYTLTAIADFSNRLFTGWWGDAQEGEEYTAEFSAPAVDNEGNEYTVYWQFDAVKGEEPEDNGNWPWYDDRISQVIAH